MVHTHTRIGTGPQGVYNTLAESWGCWCCIDESQEDTKLVIRKITPHSKRAIHSYGCTAPRATTACGDRSVSCLCIFTGIEVNRVYLLLWCIFFSSMLFLHRRRRLPSCGILFLSDFLSHPNRWLSKSRYNRVSVKLWFSFFSLALGMRSV